MSYELHFHPLALPKVLGSLIVTIFSFKNLKIRFCAVGPIFLKSFSTSESNSIFQAKAIFHFFKC